MKNMSTLKEKTVASAAAYIFLALFFIFALATTASATGTIVIIENAFPGSPDSFGFNATGQVSQNFSLVDTGVVGPDRITFSNVPAGSTTVTQESLPYPWELTNVSCGVSGSGGSNTVVNLPARLVNINLADGDTVTCTFGNAVAGLIVDTTSDTDFTSVGGCEPGAPPNTCSLRTAILYAQSLGIPKIVFIIPTTDPGYDAGDDRYTITLTSALPALDAAIIIHGPGAKRVTVKRGVAAAFRIFTINSGATVSIIGLTISHGFANEGGGIRNAGTLSITGSVIRDNLTKEGPTLFCSGANLNGGDGGGIYNGGHVTILSSSVIGNRTGDGGQGNFDPESPCNWEPGNGGSGGAIANHLGTAIIRNSTFNGNQTGNGGIIAGSTGMGDGGNGSAVYNTGSLSISNTTINANQLGNNARGSVFNDSGQADSFSLTSSIVANTIGEDDIFGIVTSGDHNLVEDPGGILPGANNITGVDPLLGPLADNGGPTFTHALLPGSPAIDAGSDPLNLLTDQRGTSFDRVVGAAADIGAFEIQPACSNTAPVAVDDSYNTNEDPASPLTGNVLANDTDGEDDTLTAALTVAAPSGLTFNADGSFSYSPAANFNGVVQFTYKANDGSLDSNVATVTITVNPVNDAPQVSATPETQAAVQYSDAIATVTINASDVETLPADLTIAFSYSKDGGVSQAGLPAGMTQGGVAGAWTVSGVAGVPQGTYVVTATVTDTGDGSSAAISSSDTFTIVVTRENAVAAPQASNPVSKQVGSPGGTASGSGGTICFDITEPADGSAGNTSLIDSATVTINAVGGGSGAITISTGAVSFSGGGIGGTRTACITLTLANTPANVYEVILQIGGNYYTGSGTTVFTVFDPSAGNASGGGWIINPNTGYRANYGVHMKYARNGNVQGSVLYVEHRPDGDYKVKGTALASKGAFAIIPLTGGAEARMTGKATFGFEGAMIGNYSFIVRMIDMGTPGTNDRFGLKLINPSGQTLTSFTFDPMLLGGGNNQVPK